MEKVRTQRDHDHGVKPCSSFPIRAQNDEAPEPDAFRENQRLKQNKKIRRTFTETEKLRNCDKIKTRLKVSLTHQRQLTFVFDQIMIQIDGFQCRTIV